jgi:hypothetical protein
MLLVLATEFGFFTPGIRELRSFGLMFWIVGCFGMALIGEGSFSLN